MKFYKPVNFKDWIFSNLFLILEINDPFLVMLLTGLILEGKFLIRLCLGILYQFS